MIVSHIATDWFVVRCRAPGSQFIVWDATRAKCEPCIRAHRSAIPFRERLRFDFRRHVRNPVNDRVALWRELWRLRRG